MLDATEQQNAALKEKLLIMASHVEAAVNSALRALVRRDDELARATKEDDRVIDRLEVEMDEAVMNLLASGPAASDLRLLTTAMKITHDLERIGDEATTISRRCMELSREPRLQQVQEIPPMGALAVQLLHDALDAFVRRDAGAARAVIPRDKELDRLHKRLYVALADYMSEHPEAVMRCLNLMVIAKCLERIGDHAANVAEMVVYMCEGRDIRHTNAARKSQAPPATGAP